jgi:hypothetical protein
LGIGGGGRSGREQRVWRRWWPLSGFVLHQIAQPADQTTSGFFQTLLGEGPFALFRRRLPFVDCWNVLRWCDALLLLLQVLMMLVENLVLFVLVSEHHIDGV